MRKNMQTFTVRASVVAVQTALVALATLPMAYAADLTAADLTQPTNSVEVGIHNVDKGSYKFGEYNGLEKKGASADLGFSLRGASTDGATQFRVSGKNLGLDNREMAAEFGQQGKFRFNVGYNEIVKNRSDSFQTPYNGAGSNNLSLPANWATNSRNCSVSGLGSTVGAVNGTAGCGNYFVSQSTAAGAATATPTGNMGALTAAERADFHDFNLSTQRKKTDLGFSFAINPQWSLGASAIHETKDGAQAIGQPINGTASYQVTLPNPVSYTTNQFNLSLDFKGDKSFAQAAYYGSIFQDGIQSVTFQNPFFSSATPQIAANGVVFYPFSDQGRFATAPNNQFHQLNLTGGYNFSPTTKLVATASYGRNTQNQDYMPLGTGPWETAPRGVLPQASLNGLVITKAFTLKLTARPIKDLKLAAAYQYDDKDNQTGVNRYFWRDTDLVTPYYPTTTAPGTSVFPSATAGPTTLGGMYSNRGGTLGILNLPYSKKIDRANLDADYSITKGQAVKLGYENLKTSYSCNGWSVPCTNATDLKENTWKLEYRNTMLATVSGRIGYLNSERDASDYGNTPYATAGLAGDTLTRFFMTDRSRDKWRASINWQPVDAFEMTASYDLTKDSYTLGKNPAATTVNVFGMDSTKNEALNLDGSYRLSDKLSFNAFYSRENISRVTGSGSATNVLSFWSADMKDKVDTYGLGFKALQVGGKWDLSGDYVKSKSDSPYALSGGSQSVNAGVTYAPIASTFNDWPSTYSDSDTFRFNASYALDKKSSVRVGYTYQKLSSADQLTYNGLQMGAINNVAAGSATAAINGVAVPLNTIVPISSLVPTNEQSPNYTVQMFNVTYVYSFK